MAAVTGHSRVRLHSLPHALKGTPNAVVPVVIVVETPVDGGEVNVLVDEREVVAHVGLHAEGNYFGHAGDQLRALGQRHVDPQHNGGANGHVRRATTAAYLEPVLNTPALYQFNYTGGVNEVGGVLELREVLLRFRVQVRHVVVTSSCGLFLAMKGQPGVATRGNSVGLECALNEGQSAVCFACAGAVQ